MTADRYQYYAFISYNKHDAATAKWLHRKLENYRLPAVLRKEHEGRLPVSIKPVFLDQADIGIGSLESNLQKELADSRYLIVVCSPASAKSSWVNSEVKHFVAMQREDRIVPFITAGSPDAEDKNNRCYPDALSPLVLGASVPQLGKEKAFIKTVARLFGLRFDELWNRTLRQKKQRFITKIAVAASLLIAMMFFGYKFYDNWLQKKEARQKAILAKAADLVNNANRLETDDPAKALLLYANAYYLNPSDSIFSILDSFYKKRTGAFEDLYDSALHLIGTFNLFPKTITGPYEYDVDNDTLEEIGIEYEAEDLVKFSRSRKLILTLDHNRIHVYNWASKTTSEINMESVNILHWDYNDFNNTVIIYGARRQDEVKDVWLYRLDNNKIESLYRYNFLSTNLEVLGYFLDSKGQNIHDTASIMNNEYEMGLRIFPIRSGPYFIIYNTSHIIGKTNSGVRKFGIINTDDPGFTAILSVTGDVNYQFKKVISVSPDGEILVVRFKDLSEPAKVIAFFPGANQQLRLEMDVASEKIPRTVSWITSGGKQYYIMGNDDGMVQVKDPFSFTQFTLFNYQIGHPPGSITCLAHNDKFIVAGSSAGFILAWPGDISNWRTGFGSMKYNVASLRVSNEPVEDIQLNGDTLLYRDGANVVSMCKLTEKIKLSKNVDELRKQFDAMNINSLSAKDSLNFALKENWK